jgi:signal transduction histidine kinase
MRAIAALTLYPTWALAVLFAVTAVRLGRSARHGLVAACLSLALWMTALVLLAQPAWTALAERLIPSGMLMAGAFIHAGAQLGGGRHQRRLILAAYGLSAAVAISGALAPWWYFGPGVHGPGPLFAPLGVLSALGTVALALWLLAAAARTGGAARWRLIAVAAGSSVGALASGAAIALRIVGVDLVQPLAPLLLVSVLLVGWAVMAGEYGRARRLIGQGLVYALLTATFSAIGLTVFYALVPSLMPGRSLGWWLFVLFCAALPLDGVRLVVVENIGRMLFRRPSGTRDLADEAEQSETRAEQLGRLAELGTVVSAVAHEIRNPLGIIAAQAKLLERAGADAESVAALRAQVERARHFLDDLLRYGKPRPLDLVEVPLDATLQSAVAGVRAQLGAAHEGTRLAVECQVPSVAADRGAVVDVVTALVHNAAVATAEQPDGQVRVHAQADGDAVVIAVEDNGPGVPPEIERTLFQPFVSGRGRDARHPGTGLGLAIARGWVERHGGRLWYERRAGGGARFVARWPRGGAHG